MKKLALLLVCFLVTSGTSFSQLGQTTEDFQISANVLSALTITEVTPLQFGSVFPGENKTISIAGVSNYSVAGETKSAAVFDIAGAAGRQISITFSGHTSISNGSSMSVTYIAGDAKAIAPSSATPGTAGSWDPTSAAETIALDPTNGTASVFLGGQVNPVALQSTGAYSGTATITVAYTGS
jgi:hypothetical protein